MLVAPKGKPSEVVQEINSVIQKVLTVPKTIAMFSAEGSIAMLRSPGDAKTYIGAEQKKWADLIQDAGIKADQ